MSRPSTWVPGVRMMAPPLGYGGVFVRRLVRPPKSSVKPHKSPLAECEGFTLLHNLLHWTCLGLASSCSKPPRFWPSRPTGGTASPERIRLWFELPVIREISREHPRALSLDRAGKSP